VRHLKRGNKGTGAPIIIRARSRPNLPSCESLYGLSRTGFRNALPEASADPYGKSSRLLVGNHRRSEALFTMFYNRLVRREGDPPAQTFLLGFDSMPILAEKSLYDLASWSREHPGQGAGRHAVGTDPRSARC
jgi:hypothetical protein